jgi:hypothetical protein
VQWKSNQEEKGNENSKICSNRACGGGPFRLRLCAGPRKGGTGRPAGKWSTRTPVKPDPSKIKVPPGYKVGVFASGLDTITSLTVDKNDNVWVAISGNTFGFPPQGIDKPHVKIFDKSGKLIKDNVGLGMFKSFALNEIGYCAENGRTYVGDYSYGIWEIDGVNGTPKLIMNEVPIGDHALGGITCRDGYLYYAVGAPSNSGFSDPNIHGWTDAVDPYWEKRTTGRNAAAAARSALPRHRADRSEHPRHGGQPHGRVPAQGHAVQAGPGHQGAETVRWRHPSRQAEGRQQLQDR